MEGNVIRLELPAEHKYLNLLSVCISALIERIDDLADAETVAYNLDLAVHEACTNIVRHAYRDRPAGKIEAVLTLEEAPTRFILDLYDTGQPFDPTTIPDPCLDKPHVHGYGLFLMKELLDDVHYRSLADKNHWRLVMNL